MYTFESFQLFGPYPFSFSSSESELSEEEEDEEEEEDDEEEELELLLLLADFFLPLSVFVPFTALSRCAAASEGRRATTGDCFLV